MNLKKLSDYELKVAVGLLEGCYGRYFCQTPEELSELVSNEFDCTCSPGDVERYVNVLTTEEEDSIIIYKNITA